MSSGMFGQEFRDPYADLVLSHILSARDALSLSPEEYAVLLASIRSTILTSTEIRKVLDESARATMAELRSARAHFPDSLKVE